MNTEILAPCGTWESLEAAVKAGADAVYLGGELFSARAYAGNFDKDELLRAIDYCHIYDVRIYLALNTLLKDTEIGLIRDYMEPFYHAGLDGVIVQDMGVCRVLKDHFPDLPLHASTQMSISSSFGAQFLKDQGFTRVVPARELSLAEIRSIKDKVDIEIETFVHGAMCFAYSGKCLMSSFIGGRSGNRGRCAQPCRQRWKLSENGRLIADRYVMSLKDMCTLGDMEQLIGAGIDSFKIEGRMKKPEYTAMTVAAYKEVRDMLLRTETNNKNDIANVISENELHLKDIYNRGGFENGYYFRQNGANMLASDRPNHTGVKVGAVSKIAPPFLYIKLTQDVNPQDVLEFRTKANQKSDTDLPVLTAAQGSKKESVLKLKGREFDRFVNGMEVYRVRNNALIESIETDILAQEKQTEACALVRAFVGEPLKIDIWEPGACNQKGSVNICALGNIVQKASNKPSSPEVIKEKMLKTGGSGVMLEVTCEVDDGAFIPMSELNNLRRKAIDDYKSALAARYRRELEVRS